ncbi:polymorphic toxin type 47 domain-containing protein [Acinetobacter sp. WU_MDCI_Abxe161]|uniref:polymorphic toxin type 47 domain-containing protein n=1 Tax=Acinetobacter sp. WU_MDCI_Abxe161 TaxID=2850074 RepID=UPI0039752D6B
MEYRTILGSKYKGAEVSVDVAHDGKGTLAVPHVGWQTSGKGEKSVVGHILLDDVSANRSKEKVR